jgi:hypothetical protein
MIQILVFSFLYADATPSAIVLKSSGVIELHRQDETKQVADGEILYSGDEVISKEASLAAIRFVDDGAIIKLFANSILTINTEKTENRLDKNLYLEVGELWSKVSKEKGSYEIETPTAVAAVKGTDFLTEVKEGGDTWLFTFEGVVELKSEMGTVEVDKGKTGIATKDSAPSSRETKKGEVRQEVSDEIKSVVETNVMEIEFKDASGQTKTMKIFYK